MIEPSPSFEVGPKSVCQLYEIFGTSANTLEYLYPREQPINPVWADSSALTAGIISKFVLFKMQTRDWGQPSHRELPNCTVCSSADASTTEMQIACEYDNRCLQFGILYLNATHKPSNTADEEKSLQLNQKHRWRGKKKKNQEGQANEPLGYCP